MIPIGQPIPGPDSYDDPIEAGTTQRALDYMGLQAGSFLRDVAVDTIFIGTMFSAMIGALDAGEVKATIERLDD